jgi:hypothetical protein
MTMKWILPLMLLALVVLPACSKASANGDVDPKAIEAKYGLTGGYVGEITTPDGKIKATIIPTTMADGRPAQLVIPLEHIDPDHQVFLRDGITMTPLQLSDPRVARQDFVQSQPGIVERRPVATSHAQKRSWEKEALIIGGGAGAGAAIGGIAGGGKGAGIGALGGGAAGLIYDLTTRNKK